MTLNLEPLEYSVGFILVAIANVTPNFMGLFFETHEGWKRLKGNDWADAGELEQVSQKEGYLNGMLQLFK